MAHDTERCSDSQIFTHGSSCLLDVEKLRRLGIDKVYIRLIALMEAVHGPDVAAIRLAEAHTLACANNPDVAAALLAEEERRSTWLGRVEGRCLPFLDPKQKTAE
jgi:hypothetical protein